MITFLALILVARPPQDTLGYDFLLQTSQEISSPQVTQETVHNLITTQGHLSVILRDTVGGRVAQIRIDTSSTKWKNPSLGDAVVPIATNTRFTVVLKAGMIQGSVAPDQPSLGALQAIPLINALFPRIRYEAAIGDRWTDTLMVSNLIAGIQITGTQTIQWEVLDRQGDLLTANATTTAASRTTLATDNILRVTQNGTIRVSVHAPGPVAASQVIESATVNVRVGGIALRVRQQTTVNLGLDGPAPRLPRRRVPT